MTGCAKSEMNADKFNELLSKGDIEQKQPTVELLHAHVHQKEY